jgi:TatA/E family protein of Tat protein translocase
VTAVDAKGGREESPMFDLFQPTHLLFVFLVALVVFGPKRLIEVSRSFGQTLRTLQQHKEDLMEVLTSTFTEDEPDKKHPIKKDRR